MSFDNSCGTACGNVSDIGLPHTVAFSVSFPSLFEFAFVTAHPVPVVGHVTADIVVEIPYGVSPSEFDLDSPVGHGRDILSRSVGITHHHIHGRCVEDAVCDLVVIVHGTGEPVLEHAEIDSDISYGCSFPSQCIVLDGSD